MKRNYYFMPLLPLIMLISCQQSADLPLRWSDSVSIPPAKGKIIQPGVAGAFAGIADEFLIIAGGANFPEKLPWQGGTKAYQKEIYIFQFVKGGLSYKDNFQLPVALAYGASVSTDQGILCIGGENADSLSSGVFLIRYQPQKGYLVTTRLANLPIPLVNHNAVLVNDKVYVAGGASTDSVSDKLFSLDISSETSQWEVLASLPRPLTNFVMEVLGGEIFVIGGRCLTSEGISELYNTVYAYNINDNSWSEKPDLPYALSAGTGISLDSNRVLLFGGDRGTTFHQTELLIQQIKKETDSIRKAILTDEKNELQENHPGFSNNILMYDKQTEKWTTVGTIPYQTPVTTTAINFHNKIIIPSGEIRAGVRTPPILVATINSK
ncbi:MAG TPA: kelch repeat-containing protein [Ginsengibacter sp.]|nr:kelch repeat-containing protein [Ginsengibacter sp.]